MRRKYFSHPSNISLLTGKKDEYPFNFPSGGHYSSERGRARGRNTRTNQQKSI
jgi:hypothetical protein